MMNLPEQTKEERDLRIKKAKLKEAGEDKWVKDNSYVLERDSCVRCLKIREKDERNYTGDRCFCSAGHAYEISNIKREIGTKNHKKEIFEIIYELGKEGINNKDNERVIDAMKKLDELEETWY